MDKFLQEKLMPIAIKLGNNKGLVAIRDGITLAVPLLLIGSLFMVIASFPVLPIYGKAWIVVLV